MEAFAVSLFRCLPRSHPLYKLLRPHLQTVSSINLKARKILIGKGTAANKAIATLGVDCARKTFQDFNMKDLMIPDVLKERGLDDPETLPKNYFRDDALKLWDIIKDFVASVLGLYYHCDDDVAKDEEVQAFAKDVATEGLGWADGNTRGMATEIKDLQELANMKRIMDSLPDLQMAQTQITLTYTLSHYSSDEVYLGEYPMHLFSDPEALEAIEKYRCNLEAYSKQVKDRNKSAGCDAYDWLLPSKIPNSIAV